MARAASVDPRGENRCALPRLASVLMLFLPPGNSSQHPTSIPYNGPSYVQQPYYGGGSQYGGSQGPLPSLPSSPDFLTHHNPLCPAGYPNEQAQYGYSDLQRGVSGARTDVSRAPTGRSYAHSAYDYGTQARSQAQGRY